MHRIFETTHIVAIKPNLLNVKKPLEMKTRLWLLAIFFLMPFATAKAEQASLSVSNSSEYTLTIKIMNCSGGLYRTLYIPPKQTRTAYFPKTGWYYTKTKAEKSLSTIYKKDDDCFQIVCDSRGYSP